MRNYLLSFDIAVLSYYDYFYIFLLVTWDIGRPGKGLLYITKK